MCGLAHGAITMPKVPAFFRRYDTLIVKILGLLVLFLATNYGFFSRVHLLIGQERYTTLLFYLGIWIISLGALFIAALQPRRGVRLFWAFIIAAATTAGWFYHVISGNSLSVYNVLSLWAARHEAGRAAAQYGQHILPAAALFIATFLIIAVPARLPRAWMDRLLGWFFWTPAVPVGLIAAIIYLKSGGGSQALPNQFQPLAVATVALERQLTHTMPPRMAVPFPPKARPRIRKIVFLVDESLRPEYLNFTPGNAETPHLPALLKTAANFGKAVSGGNCSSYANAILRFTAQREDLVTSAATYPTLWQWAKKAGFRTVFIDGQSGFAKDPGKLQNFMTVRETRFIDRFIRMNGVPTPQLDFALLERMKAELEKPGPIFIYANKNGAHFPYDADYPSSAKRYRPTLTEAGEETLQAKVNSYRNAIAWNVDEFFRRLLKDIDLSDTLIIYTSDHGQNLQPGHLTHCSTEDPSPREGLVPLLAITGDRALLARFRKTARALRDGADHFRIAPTLLRLMGYARTDLATLYGPDLFTPTPRKQPLAFSYGDIFGLFSRKAHWKIINPRENHLERLPIPPVHAHKPASMGEQTEGAPG